MKDTTMIDTSQQQDADVPNLRNGGHLHGGEEDDDSSSSLSEPEDDSEEEEETARNGFRDEQAEGGPPASQRSIEVDSEAETERLDQTPQKAQKYADGTGRTPSKLSQAATAEDELSDPLSPLPAGAGVTSGTSTLATAGKPAKHLNGAAADLAPDEEVLGQKRKRSASVESSLSSAASDLVESPRKRSHESPEEPDTKADEPVEEANGEAQDMAEEPVEDVPAEETSTPAPVAKGPKGKKGRKGRKPKETTQEQEAEQPESAEADQEPSEETAAKTEEQKQQRAQANSAFDDLAKQFTSFRERLYNERLATLTAELELLNQPSCAHPEYLRQVACVDARREKQIREANAYHFYRMQSVRQRTLGERSQLHSQYFQTIRDMRENVLYELGEDWYNIQKERRRQHQENDDAFIYKFPEKRSDQIRRQTEYNQEVSVLSGVAKHVGFPAAPEIGGAKPDSMEDDMRAMRVSTSPSDRRTGCFLTKSCQIPKRVSQPSQHRQSVLFGSSMPNISAQNERLAHDQYIEQNAWAQPQRAVHHHGYPNLTHTDNWAEPGPHSHATAAHSARNLLRNLSGNNTQNGPAARTGSPFTTPLPQKRTQPPNHSSSGTVPMGSDGPEPPSSVLAAPPTRDRMQQQGPFHDHNTNSHSTTSGGSPLVVNKHRQNGTELTGFRNISNISGVSGASTIDAPPDSAEKDRQRDRGRERERDREREGDGEGNKSLPALLTETSAPNQAFETSQLHRLHDDGRGGGGGGRREVYPANPFRAQEGAFGTPGPMQSTAAGVKH